MIILENSVFYDVPKTGCSWVAEGLVLHAGGHFEDGSSHKPPEEGDPDLFSFCFIRHPVDWYRSLYTSQIDAGKNEHANFSTFIRTVYFDGYEMFDRKWSTLEDYLAPFLTCDFVGKTESLKNDLAKAMKLAGENYPLDALLDRDWETSRIRQSTQSL